MPTMNDYIIEAYRQTTPESLELARALFSIEKTGDTKHSQWMGATPPIYLSLATKMLKEENVQVIVRLLKEGLPDHD